MKSKLAILPVVLKPTENFEPTEFSLQISEPGVFCDALVQVKEKDSGILSVSGQQPKRQLELIPVLMFQIDPDAPMRKRTFLLLPLTRIAESSHKMKYLGRLLYPDGQYLAIIEELIPWEVVPIESKE